MAEVHKSIEFEEKRKKKKRRICQITVGGLRAPGQTRSRCGSCSRTPEIYRSAQVDHRLNDHLSTSVCSYSVPNLKIKKRSPYCRD
jgi:hypothetical protein